MKQKHRIIVIMFFILWITGCASAPPVKFEGASNANQKLTADAYNMVALVTKVQGCESIDKVKTEITEPPSGFLAQRSQKNAG